MDHALTIRALDEQVASRGAAGYGFVKEADRWQPRTWLDLRRGYLATSTRLRQLARPPGAPLVVGILADACFEWNVCDLATLAARGVVVGIYVNDRDEVLRHILATSKPTVVAVQHAAMLARLQRLDPSWGTTRPVLVMQGDAPPGAGVHLLRDWLAQPLRPDEEALAIAALQEATPNDVAAHVYTSGTSGLPKAAVLTQGNLLHTAATYARYYPVDGTDRALLFLPFAHVFARVMYYAGLFWGLELYYARSADDVITDLTVVRPSVLLVVPRILERVKNKTLETVRASGAMARAIFRWATGVGHRYFVERRRGLGTRLLLPLARALVLRTMQKRFGGRLRFMGCGGGKLAPEVAQFFFQFDLPIYEGYATTESGGFGVFNRPDAWRPGYVGKPVPELEVKLASDGEVLMRSPSVFAGYLGDAEASSTVLRDGWLLTGDIGEVDGEGYLKIIDRKKDIIATANGKKVAPSWIESRLVAQPGIAQAVVIGEGRPYLVSLIVPSGAEPVGTEHIERAITATNGELARHEQIRRFQVVPEFALGTEAVTATLKLRREAIARMYRDEIERMYA